MAKKSKKELPEQPSLEDQLEAAQKALSAARSGLLRISSLDPVNFTIGSKKTGPGIVRAFNKAQEVAEKTLTTSSDLESFPFVKLELEKAAANAQES